MNSQDSDQGLSESTSSQLISTLASHAHQRPNRPFSVHIGSQRTLSYLEAWQYALKFSTFLAEHGVAEKSRVALVAHNHWLTFPLIIACNMRQAALVPIDPDLHRDALVHIIERSTPALVLVGDDCLLSKLPGQAKVLSISDALGMVDSINTDSGIPLQPKREVGSAVTLIMFTSGSTGSSKAVMLTADNLYANAASLCARYNVEYQDRFFCTLPTFHMNAVMMTGMLPLVAGACVCLSDILSFRNAKLFWQRLAEYDISICSLVPSIMALLLKLFPQGPNVVLPHLRFGFCGAAPLSEDTWKRFESTFSVPIYQGYGLTETTCWAVSTPPDGPRKYRSVGTPLPGICQVKIGPATSQDDEVYMLQPQKTGLNASTSAEVLIRGAIVSAGYYKNKKLTKKLTTRDGFYRTGDLGFFDDDGYLYVSGRIKDIIIKNGSNVASADVDQVLMSHPAIQECKTFGLPDPLVGERICVACVPKNGAQISELNLRSWAYDRLSHHMRPDAIELLGHLPKTAAGKISVDLLRKLVTGKLSDEIVSALNVWKYKRAQPSNLEAIREIIDISLRQGEPVDFLAYWGCGTRSGINERDVDSLHRLDELIRGARRIPAVAPRMTLILTDVHARNNRIPEQRIQEYYGAVKRYANHLGMRSIWLSDIWKNSELSIEQVTQESKSQAFNKVWQTLSLKDSLVAQAAKHFEQNDRNNENQNIESAAKFYYLACNNESAAIAKRYPRAIFTTYNHPDFDFLLPDLPKMYLYSYKEGTSVKPWFADAA